MYKILHWLFGWDYIAWRNSAASGIARIHVDGMGKLWYWRYKGTKVIDYIDDPESVTWLTCSPAKYAPEKRIPLGIEEFEATRRPNTN